MPNPRIGDQESGNSRKNNLSLFSSFYFLVSNICGVPVDNTGKVGRKSPESIHRLMPDTAEPGENSRQQAGSSAQPESFLYTVFQHNYTILTSVFSALVPAFHSAYINNRKANKGVC